MKKIISILLAIILVSMTTVTAFAISEEEQRLRDYKDGLLCTIKMEYQDEFLFDGGLDGGPDYSPLWSKKTKRELYDVVEFIKNNIDNCKTIEEVAELEALLLEAIDNMCLDPEELNWLLEFMQKDYTSVGYYDEATMAELKNVYDQAQSAYESGDGDLILTNYLLLRNEFNKLCLYNTTIGDINMDGEFTIDDITYIQKHIADLETMNSSQEFLSCIDEFYGVDCVTNWQYYLADIKDVIYSDSSFYINYLKEYSAFDLNNIDKSKIFNDFTDSSNYLYDIGHHSFIDYYYYNIYQHL